MPSSKEAACAPALSETVIEKIKNAGFRMTQSRLKILELFSETTKALSPTEVFDRLLAKNKKEGFDRVTVYRILEKFEDLEIIHNVGNGKYVYCAHQSCDHDQHFILICNSCNQVQEMGGPAKVFGTLIDQVKKESGFAVAPESVVLRGLCAKCQRGNS